MNDDTQYGDPLERLFDDCVERLARGETLDLESLCVAHPDDAERIRAALTPLVGSVPADIVVAGRLPIERIGEFRLIRELGAGGMGIVYLAIQESLGRRVALKTMKPAFAQSPHSRERFRREAAIVGKLAHPSIVTVHTAGEHDGALYLAMDYVEGRGLDELIAEARASDTTIPIHDAVRYAAEIARALESAHAAGVVHRDIKPSNVRVGLDGRAKLLDFGLARDRDSIKLTLSGEFQGSPYYTPPEWVGRGFGEPDARSDIYALGVTLYESLTGEVPFPGTTLEQVLHAIVSAPPPRPRDSNAALSRDLETVVLKSLEKDPARRYATAAEFADDLEAVLALRPIRARPPSIVRRALGAAKRNPWRTVPLVTACVAVIVYAGSFAYSRRMARVEAGELVAHARDLASHGQFGASERALADALARVPDLAAARDARIDLDHARRVAEVDRLLESAKEAAREHAATLERRTKTRDELAPSIAARNVRYLDAEASQRLDRGEIDLASLDAEVDRLEATATVAIERALALAPERQDLGAVLADMHFARFLADERADPPRAAIARANVERYDAARRLRSDLVGAGSLSIETDPPEAEVHLYRYVEQATLSATGERRLVPVPVNEWKPPRPFGAWVLVATQDAGEIASGDLVLGVAGRLIRNTVLVSRGNGDVDRLDRLVSVDGRSVRDPFDAHYAEELDAGADGLRDYVFERGGANRTIRAASLRAIGVEVDSPANIAAKGGVAAEVFHDGAVMKLTLPEGIEPRATGAPLYRSSASLLGVAPIVDSTLPPGSYLALLSAPGREDARLPFVMPRGGKLSLRAELPTRESVPPGYRAIAGGTFLTGPDWRQFPPRRLEIELAPFLMMEREVTFRDWLEFLADPEIRARLDDLAALDRLIPRRATTNGSEPLLSRSSDGAYFADPNLLDLPLHGISFAAARDYAEWRSRRSRAAGQPWRFELPTAGQWEWAARGADDRALVCGDHFVANWLGSALARPRALIEPVLSFPVDESPFGVFDLGGSMNEWCAPDDSTNDQSTDVRDAIVRGGAWDTPRPEAFRTDWFATLPAATRSTTVGFRLIARSD